MSWVQIDPAKTEREQNIVVAKETAEMVAELIDSPGSLVAGATIAGTIRRDGDQYVIDFGLRKALPAAPQPDGESRTDPT